jgi:tetratricopeptide (TPR) repeat protein
MRRQRHRKDFDMSEKELQALADMIRRGNGDAALGRAMEGTAEPDADADCWSTRAFVEDLLEMFDAADMSISKAMSLDPSAGLSFKRASIRLKAGHTARALDDALAIIASGDTFYRDEALLLAAEARRRLGRWEEAMRDCEALPENAEVWSGGLIAAREIRSQCSRMLAQQKAA